MRKYLLSKFARLGDDFKDILIQRCSQTTITMMPTSLLRFLDANEGIKQYKLKNQKSNRSIFYNNNFVPSD